MPKLRNGRQITRIDTRDVLVEVLEALDALEFENTQENRFVRYQTERLMRKLLQMAAARHFNIPSGFFEFDATQCSINISFARYASNVCVASERIFSIASLAFSYRWDTDVHFDEVAKKIIDLYVLPRLEGGPPRPLICCGLSRGDVPDSKNQRACCYKKRCDAMAKHTVRPHSFTWNKHEHGWTLKCQRCLTLKTVPILCSGDLYPRTPHPV